MGNKKQQMLLKSQKTNKGKVTLQRIQESYHQNDICMGDLLLSVPADGLSLEEAFELAIAAKKWADGDRFYRIVNDGKPEEI